MVKTQELNIDSIGFVQTSTVPNTLLLWGKENTFIYDLETNDNISLGYFVGWLEDGTIAVFIQSDCLNCGEDSLGEMILYDIKNQTQETIDAQVTYAIHTSISPSTRYILYRQTNQKVVYDTEMDSIFIIEDDREPNWNVDWLNIEDQDWLVLQDTALYFRRTNTFLLDPETGNQCAIGITGQFLELQPQP